MRRTMIAVATSSCIGNASAFILNDDSPLFAQEIKKPDVAIVSVKKQAMITETKQVVSVESVKQPEPVVPKIEHRATINGSGDMALVLLKHARDAGIKGTELSQLMAQAAHESAGFKRLIEVGDIKYFKKYDPVYNPKLAEKLGNIYHGDGAKYRGRGFLQLTGRDNYRRAGLALGLPLEQYPEMVSRPDIAAKTSIWYWKTRVQPEIDNWKDTHAVTREVNGGLRGIKDRIILFFKFRSVIDR